MSTKMEPKTDNGHGSVRHFLFISTKFFDLRVQQSVQYSLKMAGFLRGGDDSDSVHGVSSTATPPCSNGERLKIIHKILKKNLPISAIFCLILQSYT